MDKKGKIIMEIRVLVSNEKTAEALASFIMSEAVREMVKNQGGEILGVLLPGDEADLEEGLITQEELTEEILTRKNAEMENILQRSNHDQKTT
jgi:hypothetical protein